MSEDEPAFEGRRREAQERAILRAARAGALVLFCDFDGTFSRRDVGGSLAREYLPELRAVLQERYQRGELSAWEYALELFGDFDFDAERLNAFLGNIELDPGAHRLVEWCRMRRVAFQILSDGFDFNLDRLQAIHSVKFSYSANHLSFEGGRWKIRPGGRNAECGCGTGMCKRGVIAKYRVDHPEAYCIHVGDGRVSDFCGAEAADLVFAKGSLASALRAQGIPFEAFENLHDVRSVLERTLQRGSGRRSLGSRASGDFQR